MNWKSKHLFKKTLKDALDPRILAYGGFLSAGYFKSDPRLNWLPVDLTILFAAICGGLVFYELVRTGFRIQSSMVTFLLLFTLFLVPVAIQLLDNGTWAPGNPYEAEKSLRLFTVTLTSALGASVLIKSRSDFGKLALVLSVLGAVQAIDAALMLTSGTVQERLSGFGQNAIALGRAVGVPLVCLGILVIEQRIPKILGIPAILLLSVALLTSGSRGPLVAVALSVGISSAFSYRGNLRQTLLWGFIVALGLWAAMILLESAAPIPIQRLTAIFDGKFGAEGSSESARMETYLFALEQIPKFPFGSGWAHFSQELGGYPHNILLEVALEAGWIPAVLLTLLIIRSMKSSFTKLSHVEGRLHFALLCYFLLNAMVSGDINHNKFVFVFMAVALSRSLDRGGREPLNGKIVTPVRA